MNYTRMFLKYTLVFTIVLFGLIGVLLVLTPEPPMYQPLIAGYEQGVQPTTICWTDEGWLNGRTTEPVLRCVVPEETK